MQARSEFIIKVYEDGHIRIPIKIREKLLIHKGSNLILKLEKNGSINIDTIEHKIDKLREKISSQIGSTSSLVDEFLNFKKSDDSRF